MSSTTLATLALVAAVAVVSPLVARLLRRFRIPAVVIEIVAGIIIGPQVLDLVRTTSVVESFSALGLAFLMFLAGYEIDFDAIRGAPIRLATWGWLLSLALGLAFGFLLQTGGQVISWSLIGLVLTTTAFGTMLPMWRDAGLLQGRFGAHLLAVGTLGEFGPIVAIALLLSGDSPVHESLVLVAFALIAVGGALLAARPTPPRVLRVLRENLHTSAQLPVRVSILLIIGLLWIASSFGLDVLLGAFTAGVLIRLASAADDTGMVRHKLEAIGFGFLIPIFFVVSGMDFDLDALLESSAALARLPIFLVLFLVVRGIPVILYRREFIPELRWPFALFSATALPLVVAITEIGTETGRLRPENAASLVGAAMLSVLVYPLLAFTLLGRAPATTEGSGEAAPTDAPRSA